MWTNDFLVSTDEIILGSEGWSPRYEFLADQQTG